jgi:15-cis-phytoene synthase
MTPVERDNAPEGLPRPFYEGPWRGAGREAAVALWNWHENLYEGRSTTVSAERIESEISGQRPVDLVPRDVALAAYEACRAHSLPTVLLAEQAVASLELRPGLRFATGVDMTDFVSRFVVPHGRLLGSLACVAGSWQLPWVDEITKGFFFISRLVYLPSDLERDRLFFPLEDLERASVSLDQLKQGRIDEGMRKLLWKQSIRARDALAQGKDLVRELPRSHASHLRQAWMVGLEVLNEIERRDYDVWSPITLSRGNRLQAWFQSRFGRTTFRRK